MGKNTSQQETQVQEQNKIGAEHLLAAQVPSKVAVLCDFDGTIALRQVIPTLYEHFAGPSCMEVVQRWMRGEVGTKEEFRICFGSITASRAEMEAVLDSVPIDPAFPRLLDFCRQRGYRFAIVSDGLRWYINYILARYGIHGLTVYANEIYFEPQGIRLAFPWYSADAPLRGVSKKGIIRRYQADGCKVVFIGDGLSDIDAVQVADVLYANDDLLAYCRKHGIPAIEFSDLSDVLAKWVYGLPSAVSAVSESE